MHKTSLWRETMILLALTVTLPAQLEKLRNSGRTRHREWRRGSSNQFLRHHQAQGVEEGKL